MGILILFAYCFNVAAAALAPAVDDAAFTILPLGNGATVSGGFKNSVSGNFSTVGGGLYHRALGPRSTIAGGSHNLVAAQSEGGFIGGGGADAHAVGPNVVGSDYGAVVGGHDNTAVGPFCFVGGGEGNEAGGLVSVVSGGEANTVFADHAVIAGGIDNFVSGSPYASILGGSWNYVGSGSNGSAIAGGANNMVSASHGFIGAGLNNYVYGKYAAVMSGTLNEAGTLAVVAGGRRNTADGVGAFIGGGGDVDVGTGFNRASGTASSVLGGFANTASGTGSVAMGSRTKASHNYSLALGFDPDSTAAQPCATMGDGSINMCTKLGVFVNGVPIHVPDSTNVVDDVQLAYVANGLYNTATGYVSIVMGGSSNSATGSSSMIGSGMLNLASGSLSAVVGGDGNVATSDRAAVGGGSYNGATGVTSTVGGGQYNTAGGTESFVGGGGSNSAMGRASAVLGGGIPSLGSRARGRQLSAGGIESPSYSPFFGNRAFADFSAISGGTENVATGVASSVAGGFQNTASGRTSLAAGNKASAVHAFSAALGFDTSDHMCFSQGNGTVNLCADKGVFVMGQPVQVLHRSNSFDAPGTTIAGGFNNMASINASIGGGDSNSASALASVGGGVANFAIGFAAVIGGGFTNAAVAAYATVGGGHSSSAAGDSATVSGGRFNIAGGAGAAIGGGDNNIADGEFSAVGGGTVNAVVSAASFVGGGVANTVMGNYSAVAGGALNSISAHNAAVGGGSGNLVFGDFGIVAGGESNVADFKATVSGGDHNSAMADHAVVSGGSTSIADGIGSVVGGGAYNVAVGYAAVVAGGFANTAAGPGTFVGGGGAVGLDGAPNRATGDFSSILGGFSNDAFGNASTVLGGFGHTVSGFASVALGANTHVSHKHAGAFGFGSLEPCYSAGAHTLSICAEGGLFVNGMEIGAGGFVDSSNAANGSHSFIAGGFGNVAKGGASGVVAGSYNGVHGYASVVVGGEANAVHATSASVVGGRENIVNPSATYSFIAGGDSNTALGSRSVVLGHNGTTFHDSSMVLGFESGGTCWSEGKDTVAICAPGGFFVNGIQMDGAGFEDTSNNFFDGEYTVVVGGAQSTALGSFAFVGGGYNNMLVGETAAIVGGQGNYAGANGSSIAGGFHNDCVGVLCAVAGGEHNAALGYFAAVGGGTFNSAVGYQSVVSGGISNVARGPSSVVSGGAMNDILPIGQKGAIGGGSLNTINADHATIGGGQRNRVAGTHSIVSGGYGNTALGDYSAVIGGAQNIVTGSKSMVFGSGANVSHNYAGVLSFRDPGAGLGACSSQGEGTLNLCGRVFIDDTDLVAAIEDTNDRVYALEINATSNNATEFVLALEAVEAENAVLTERIDTLEGNLTQHRDQILDLVSLVKVQSAIIVDLNTSLHELQAEVAILSQGASFAPTTAESIMDTTLDIVDSTPCGAGCDTTVAIASAAAVITNDVSSTAKPASTSAPVSSRAVQSTALATSVATSTSEQRPTVDDKDDITSASTVAVTTAAPATADYNMTSAVTATATTTSTTSTVDAEQALFDAFGVNSSNTTAESLISNFLGTLSGDGNESATSDQNVSETVKIMSTFIQYAMATSSSSELEEQLLDGISLIGDGLSSTTTDDSVVDQFLETVNDFASWSQSSSSDSSDTTNTIEALDDVLENVCAASLQEGSGQTSYTTEQYSLSCASPLGGNGSNVTGVVVQTDSVSVSVGDVDGTVSVSTWDASQLGSDNETSQVIVSDVVGVSLTTEDGESFVETEDTSSGIAIAIAVTASVRNQSSALRRRLSCKYWDSEHDDWIGRGVFLKGIVFDQATASFASADCVSSHLTLFAVEDDSEAVKLVDAKISALSDRFNAMKGVDLLDGNTEINSIVPVTFAVATGLFFVAIVVSKVRKNKEAKRSAKRVFLQDGELSKPGVLRSAEYDAILRGWLPAKQVVWLMFLEILTSNAILSMMFSWGHDHIVFTRGDKAFILYASVLSTFLAVVFFEGGTPETDDFWISMLDAFVSSAFANILLFPVQYLLPFMIENVNSLQTSTVQAESVVKLQLNKLKRKLFGSKKSKKAVPTFLASLTGNTKVAPETSLKVVVGLWQDHTPQKSETIPVRVTRTASSDAKPVAKHGFVRRHSSAAERAAEANERAKDLKREDIDVRSLRFCCTKVKLPQTRSAWFRHAKENDVTFDTSESKEKLKAIAQFQGLVRHRQHVRRSLREMEFESWYHHMKQRRNVLATINYLFVTLLSGFTLGICLLLSAAFTEQECIDWVVNVIQSLVVSALLTDPAIALSMLLLKLFGAWILLRLDRKTRVKVEEATRDLEKVVEEVRQTKEIEVLETAIATAKEAGVDARAISLATSAAAEVKHEIESPKRFNMMKAEKWALERTESVQNHLADAASVVVAAETAVNVLRGAASLRKIAGADTHSRNQHLTYIRSRKKKNEGMTKKMVQMVQMEKDIRKGIAFMKSPSRTELMPSLPSRIARNRR